MTSEIITEDIEIRHLKQFVVHGLKELLDIRDDWKTLMSMVTVDCDPHKPYKYGQKEIRIIEHAGKRVFPQRGCTEIFLDEWGTSGRRRPKLNDLVMFLEQANLKEAVKYVLVDLLKKPYEDKENIVVDIVPSEQNLPEGDGCDSKTIRGDVVSFTLCQLERATNSFNSEPFSRGGNKLGEGQFGAVYYGRLNNIEVAVKTLGNDVTLSTTEDAEIAEVTNKLFENEVEILSQCKHTHLLRLVGFCKDTMNCIVYEFMCNGSLYDRLACLNKTPPLTTNTRYSIALGVAEALHFLHSGFSKVVIHRDVKSANVLLDDNFVPKLGDFGIVKMSDSANLKTMYTQSNSGTLPYMPPEAHHGAISTKTDVFSYGIVILELLTGLKPNDDDRKTTLYYYLVVEEEIPVREVLDRKAGQWNEACVDTMVDLVWQKCCLIEKDKRAEMKNIVDILKNMPRDWLPE